LSRRAREFNRHVKAVHWCPVFHPDGPTFLELARQALGSTQRGYDLLAPKFEHTPFRTPDPILEAMVDLLGPPRSVGAALDVCCGTGAAMKWLLPLCTERVVGIDFSPGMLAEAKRRLEASDGGGASVVLVRGDALNLPFEGEFDVVTSVGAFGHIEPKDEGPFVRGIFRALRPGGRFVFATSLRPTPRQRAFWLAHGFNGVMRVRNAILSPPFVMYYLTFLWPDVRGLLEGAGFRVEAVTGKCPAPYEGCVIVIAHKEPPP
jgi:ubiquinone/menaquinone biosynthesis C-methylase UbiE